MSNRLSYDIASRIRYKCAVHQPELMCYPKWLLRCYYSHFFLVSFKFSSLEHLQNANKAFQVALAEIACDGAGNPEIGEGWEPEAPSGPQEPESGVELEPIFPGPVIPGLPSHPEEPDAGIELEPILPQPEAPIVPESDDCQVL